ncbi:MAG: beta strand repeat-containing protein, partial [Acidimicrobiales bacterium]
MATTGSDTSNNCQTPASPCLTINHAIVQAAALTGVDVTVDIAAGTYDEAVTTTGQTNNQASLTLQGEGATSSGVVVNAGGSGPALSTNLATTVADLTLTGGSSLDGGGIYIGTPAITVTVENSTIDGNTSTTSGSAGAIYDDKANLVVTGSTISNNTAGGSPAAGIFVYGAGASASASITDSTFSGNSGNYDINNEYGSVTVIGSTFSGNTGTAINTYAFGGSADTSLGADILADGTGCTTTSPATLTDLGDNVATDSSCNLGSTSHQNVSSLSLSLGSLAANGGPTDTEAIPPQSPANDVVPSTTTLSGQSGAFCSGSDQRGDPRLLTSATSCAAGAYQPQVAPLAVTTTSPLPAGTAGISYSDQLSSSGGSGTDSWSWSASGGSSLPPGLSLSSSGLISGTPTAVGTYSVVVTVTDGESPPQIANKTVSLTVSSATTPLHVASGGTGPDCTQAAPCGSVQDALNLAPYITGAVVVDVGSGTYTENDTVLAPGASGEETSLTLQPAAPGEVVTIDDPNTSSATVGVPAGVPTTISQLTITGGGDGIDDAGGTVTVTGSTISGAALDGIDDAGGTVTVTGSTISGNAAAGMFGSGTVTVTGSTISGNADGISGSGVTASLGADLLDNPNNCVAATVTDLGDNVATDSSCNLGSTSHQNVPATSLGLGSLAANGGPTDTEAIPPQSPANDVVPSTTTLSGQSGAFCSG